MRANPFVKMGRPASSGVPKAPRSSRFGSTPGGNLSAPPGAGLSPMAGFSGAMPGAAFRQGGSVNGYKRMAHSHSDADHGRGHSEHGFASVDAHHKRLCRGGKA